MKTIATILMVSAAWTVGAVERTEVDFSARAGTIRRALHSSGWDGQLAVIDVTTNR